MVFSCSKHGTDVDLCSMGVLENRSVHLKVDLYFFFIIWGFLHLEIFWNLSAYLKLVDNSYLKGH